MRIALALLTPGLVACAATPAPTAPRTPSTSASAPSAPSAPALDPSLASLAFYVGSWKCRGTTYDAPGQAEKTWDATLEVAPELGGKWLSVQMIGPGSSRTIEHKGYDSEKKQWVHLAVANDGSWNLLTSDGWTGSDMVFRIEGEDERARATFTKRSETEYSHGISLQTEAGTQKLWEKVCRKV
jgi:hypothetical protein